MKKAIKDIFLELMFNILKHYMNFIIIYDFYHKEEKLRESESLFLIYVIKLDVLFTLEIKSLKASIKS